MSLITKIGCVNTTTDESTIYWRIPNFFSLSGDVDTEYTSYSFMFDHSIWCLRLFPHGDNRSQYLPGWVGVYLRREKRFTGTPKRVYYTFGIKTSCGVEKRDDIQLKYPRREVAEVERMKMGIRCFWLSSELWDRKSTLLPNNMLTIVCDLSICRPDNGLKAGAEKVVGSLLSMLQYGVACDIVIKVQEKEFPAHRVILQARSPVFRDFLSLTRNNVVTIKDGDPEAFVHLIYYIYSGSCKGISRKNVCSLYTDADRFGLGDLKVKCAKYMKRNIAVDSFCDIITLAVKHEDKELIKHAKYFFCHNSVAITKTVEWQTFLEENSTVANELLSNQCENK